MTDSFATVCYDILFGSKLSDKLQRVPSLSQFTPHKCQNIDLPKFPGRSKNIMPTDKKIKFPKVGGLHDPDKRAIALHFFANHELQTIEMLAAAFLTLKSDGPWQRDFQQKILLTLKEEQTHFELYCERLQELGVEFGDLPVNDFFWSVMQKIQTPEEFLSVLSLTFEGANLDFALYYEKVFCDIEDFSSAKILRRVLKDEITHVGRGVDLLSYRKQNHSLWEFYCNNLPWPITPARSKGTYFMEELRSQAGLDNAFIQKLKSYDDEFHITRRKSWKRNSITN